MSLWLAPQRLSGDGPGGSTGHSSASSRWRRGWGCLRMSCPALDSQTVLPAGGRNISTEAASALFYWGSWQAEPICHCALEEWFSLQVLEWPREPQHCQKANQQGWQRCSVTCCPPHPPRRSTRQCCAGAWAWFPAGSLAPPPEEQQRSVPAHLSVLSSGAEPATCLWMENKGQQVRHARPLHSPQPVCTSLLVWTGPEPLLTEKPQISAQSFCCTQCIEELAGSMTSALYMHLQSVYSKCRKCSQLFKSTEMCCLCLPGVEQTIMN